MKFYSIFIFVFLISINLEARQTDKLYNSLVIAQDDSTIYLEKDLPYYFFESSNDYLVWYEGYTRRILFQNLNDDTISEIELKQGRGPTEIGELYDIAIVGDQLFLLDLPNRKIVIYALNKKEFDSEFVISKKVKRLNFIEGHEGNLYAKGLGNNAVYFKYNSKTNEFFDIPKSFTEEIISDAQKNVFRFEGPFLVNNDFLISIRYYEPSLFYFSMSNNDMNDVEFDETEMKPEYVSNDYGFVTNPPPTINMRIHDAAIVGHNSSKVLLVMEGHTTKQPEISRESIYEYDIEEKLYTNVFDTNLNSIKNIASNSSFLFVYDDQSFLIRKIDYDNLK